MAKSKATQTTRTTTRTVRRTKAKSVAKSGTQSRCPVCGKYMRKKSR